MSLHLSKCHIVRNHSSYLNRINLMLSRVEHESVIIWLPGCVGSQIFFQASKYMFTDVRIGLISAGRRGDALPDSIC